MNKNSKKYVFFFQAEDGIRDRNVTGVQTCALPIYSEKTEKLWRKSSSATPAKKRNTSISVMSRTSTTSFAGRVLSTFWHAESAGLLGNFATSMRVVHQITASTHLARAAASTASLNACGVRLHWLMMKLKMMVILETIGFASSFSDALPISGRPPSAAARPIPISGGQCKLSAGQSV